MKKFVRLFCLSISLIGFHNSFSQAPNAFNYQAVLRNSNGDLLTNQAVTLRFTIRTGTSTGTIQYQETRALTTNQYGLASHVIGNGTVVSGNFNNITWNSAAKFLQVEVNPGTGFVNLGSERINSVPYALSSGDNRWTSNGDNIYNTNTDNVGIGTGTAAVTDLLQVGSLTQARNNYISVKTGGGNLRRAGIKFLHFSDNNGFTIESNEQSNRLEISRLTSTPAIAMSIDRLNGNVGIGSNNAVSDLSISQSGGSAAAQGTGGIDLKNLLHRWRIYNSNNFLRFNYSSDDGISYNARGYIDPTSGNYVSVSDMRQKLDITEVGDVLQEILKIKLYSYRYIGSPEGSKPTFGVMAQEVQELFPALVSGEQEEDLLGVDYTKLSILTLKALQEQNKLLENFESVNKDLQESILSLEDRIRMLEKHVQNLLSGK